MAKLTAETLGKILYEEFALDEWGAVVPYYFKDPPRHHDGTDYDGLYEVLQRAAAKINELVSAGATDG